MWTSKRLRQRFVDFFERRRHTVLPGISVVPPNDPTLLFTNSGMVQFKGVFLGEEAKHERVCTVQRCIRAGGKHNDLDDVGKDNYHHTFFEMLGNWSFGDYFKSEAIEYAYEFLISDLGLDRDRIYVTIYEEMDKESRGLWQRHLDDSRILSASFKDNFWEMGEFGPCGPCTEIHYDRVGGRDASHLVNQDDPDVIEIWNIVFMEYNRTPSGLVPLKRRNIDTGIGFERLLSILMGVTSNYQIDSFKSIIGFIESKCEHTFGDTSSNTDVAFRVLSDHARTMAVCIHDRVAFAADGVGYVLRRILRRAARYAYNVLGLEAGILPLIVQHAAEVMEIEIDIELVRAEERLFTNALHKGSLQLDAIVRKKGRLDAADVYLLYATYGFPKDLTVLIAEEKKIPISLDGFEACVQREQEQNRASKSVVTVDFGCAKTDDSFKYTENGVVATLQAAVRDNELVEWSALAPGPQELHLVFDRTCFYGEKGGQVGDVGTIRFLEGDETVGEFTVADTQIVRGCVLHRGTLETGRISSTARLEFDEDTRAKVRANHSVCHILYYFLRSFFKTAQRGSLVDSEKCRFDFDGSKLSDEVLKDLEAQMNAFIQSNAVKTTEVIAHADAVESGLQLEDGDYSNGVRVVSFSNGETTVKDVCGGTHVESTAEIRKVRLVKETGIKASIRRIQAVTGALADELDANAEQLRAALARGEVVTIGVPLSLSAKSEIEAQNYSNMKQNQERADSEVKETLRAFDEAVLAFKLKTKPAFALLKHEAVVSSAVSKKEFSRLAASIASRLKESAVDGLCVLRKAGDLDVIASCKDSQMLATRLNDEVSANGFRVIKGVVQGAAPVDCAARIETIVEDLSRRQ
ncbi:alanyl-tRNA synthetase [Pancytospora philotis]|nr:alanyl-tRNA synthetase [Pancytospora philotis]